MYVSDLHRQFCAETNTFLATYLEEQRSRAAKIHPSYERLWSTTAEVTIHGGKRLRPYLVLVAAGATINTIHKVLPIAAAQELLHVALLAHDDIIDHDTIRHGVKNIAGRYEETYASSLDTQSATHYAAGSAILAGDLLISSAYTLIATSSYTDTAKQQLTETMSRAMFEVAGGELMDIEAAFMQDQVYDPRTIYRYKTAGYSFIYPLLAGAITKNADQATLQALKTFGTELGIAYQLQDDLLGVFGDQSVTGKSISRDLVEGKQTYLIELFRAKASKDDIRVLSAVFGNEHASEEELERARECIVATGAQDEATKAIGSYSDRAIAALDMLSDTELKHELRTLVRALVNREQ